MKTSAYNFSAGGFDFRIFRVGKGWAARVNRLSRWANVRFPSGGCVRELTKKAMQEYLRYAYGDASK